MKYLFLLIPFLSFGEVLKTEFILKKVEDNSIQWDERNAIHDMIKGQIRAFNPKVKNFKENELNMFAESYIDQLAIQYTKFKKEYVTEMKSFDHEGNRYTIVFDYVQSRKCQLHVYELQSCGEPICGKEKKFNLIRKDNLEEKYCDLLYGKRQ